MSEIRRLAIVNRGEAAMRALAAVAELNQAGDQPPITTIACYTEPDARAWFVQEADEAIALGPAWYTDPADGRRRSRYLDEPYMVDALVRARVDTVWIGWGFVAESASFAERCERAGLVFVGPDSATIRLLGDKVAAKRLAERVGVPVVRWSGRPVGDVAEAHAHAERMGYPLLLKAALGGGGRGIRIVPVGGDLAGAFASAQREAAHAFGDPTVFLEQLLPATRHVEVQIVADGHGGTWAVGVRDCSIQRRHQKVIEESGSTALTPAIEIAMREAAVRLADAARYRGAGTVEFLLDPDSGEFWFMEVNPRLQVEHPVTEETAGVDLVKLQLHVARGGRLGRMPPPAGGHAVEARLCAEDPEREFAPAPGRLAALRMPAGPGVRVDTGVREGDTISSEFDSAIAKIIAHGRDRAEALARLRRAVRDTTVVVEGGTTNRSFLLTLLDRDEVRTGAYDNRWLDRLTAADGHLAASDPVAVLVAAVEAYDQDQAAEQAAFHERAARGGVESAAEVGHRCRLRYRGVGYRLHVYRTGRRTYRVESGGALADIDVDRISRHQRRVVVGGRTHRVTAAADGATFRIDVDGAAHTVSRDDGGVVRCTGPAFVVSIAVAVGDTVEADTPLMVLESMKMESTVTAPHGGTVAAVDVAVNAQVMAGASLLRITSDGARDVPDAAAPVDLTGLTAERGPDTPPCEWVYSALRSYLLGYDLDPATVRELTTRARRLGESADPADPGLLTCEDGLLDLFVDVGSLFRPRTAADPPAPDNPQDYLLAYLQWLDPDRAGLPAHYRRRLETALRRYGVSGLTRNPDVEQAVVWLFRSFRRAGELVPVVTNILERRLHHRVVLVPPADEALRGRMDRLAAAAQGRYQVVADLARDVRFHYIDEPVLRSVAAARHAEMDAHLDALRGDIGADERRTRLAELLDCAQPLYGLLLRRWMRTMGAPADARLRRTVLEVYVRRHYRIRDLHDTRVVHAGRRPLYLAAYEYDGRRIQLVAGFCPLDDLAAMSRAVATALARTDRDREAVVDLVTWHDADPAADGDLSARVDKLLRDCAFGRPLRRIDLTVTDVSGAGPEHARTRHVTFRERAGVFEEDPLYRGLHPMLAKRLDLWRLSNFRLERLPSPEDVYLFHGVAHDNPADHRLFALAEVRDMTPLPTGRGTASYPQMERIGLLALSAMRDARATFHPGDRPAANRIVLYVRPAWEVPATAWSGLTRTLFPLAVGVGLEKVILRVGLPQPGGGLRDRVLDVGGIDRHQVTVRLREPGAAPVRSLTPYRQKVVRASRVGAPYPYEIVRMLTPSPDAVTRFPAGWFTEYDLTADGGSAPVDRPHGQNTANIVFGLLTNRTTAIGEGMTRVIVLGDPTRGLGNLAQPECRRIIAALDLAERMRVPVEWFAVSSGARIAMDSGTENMDAIAAVLRRLIEFTQAGGEVNVIVTGVNVGAQPYWNAEATMLMHTRGILVMTPDSSLVLTGKQALDFSGGVSAEDNLGIGGYDRIMGPNGQGQYWAATLEDACDILLRHYDHTYVVPGERYPRRTVSVDPADRDVRDFPHDATGDSSLVLVGDVFSAQHNPDRKKPFDMRSVMRAVTDADAAPLERWASWRGAETAIVWDARIGGIPVCLLGVESHTVPRRGFVPAGGPSSWTSGTLFPQSSRKLARAINSASGNRPVVVLANLSGFDGSPESMRRWQLEYGAEIGRAVTNFRGPIVFVVVSRYHGGAFVVFSKALNERLEIAALEGSFASVIGGAPAAAAVFARDVRTRTETDPRVREAALAVGPAARRHLAEVTSAVRAEKLGEVADEFDAVHSVERALSVGSIDRIIAPRDLRPYLVDALDRGMAADAPVTAPAGGPPRSGAARRRRARVDPPARPAAGTGAAPPP